MSEQRWHLFEVIGVELEYMIVDSKTLDVKPICDKVMEAAAGEPCSEVERGPIAWSNELALHVIELKTNGPANSLDGLEGLFQASVREINGLLRPMGAMLMPTGMHPWMDPHRETKLWPHEYSDIYRTYDRIFDCRGHGWSNLQSTHINLPFGNDEEFGRLHAAVRLVLPLIPVLAASTPYQDGDITCFADTRLAHYRKNQAKVPIVAGRIIPEAVFSEQEYREQILAKIAAAIAPHDPDGVLHPAFLNSRGAIARFDRGAVEIRLIDLQECPAADIRVVRLVAELVKALVEERFCSYETQRGIRTEALAEELETAVEDGTLAQLQNQEFAVLFSAAKHAMAIDVWTDFAATSGLEWPRQEPGNLSNHITDWVEGMDEDLRSVYRRLCSALQDGQPFAGPDLEF